MLNQLQLSLLNKIYNIFLGFVDGQYFLKMYL